jgi:hypothetical protein
MTPEDKQSQTETTSQESQENQKAKEGKELIDELTRLGQKFVEVVEVAWNSEQRKKAEEDLRAGLVTVASTLEESFKKLSNTKEAKEVVNAAEDVAGKVRSSKIASELSGTLAQGLRSLSEEMEKFSADLKQKSQSAQSTKGEGKDAQDIPISRPTPPDDNV